MRKTFWLNIVISLLVAISAHADLRGHEDSRSQDSSENHGSSTNDPLFSKYLFSLPLSQWRLTQATGAKAEERIYHRALVDAYALGFVPSPEKQEHHDRFLRDTRMVVSQGMKPPFRKLHYLEVLDETLTTYGWTAEIVGRPFIQSDEIYRVNVYDSARNLIFYGDLGEVSPFPAHVASNQFEITNIRTANFEETANFLADTLKASLFFNDLNSEGMAGLRKSISYFLRNGFLSNIGINRIVNKREIRIEGMLPSGNNPAFDTQAGRIPNVTFLHHHLGVAAFGLPENNKIHPFFGDQIRLTWTEEPNEAPQYLLLSALFLGQPTHLLPYSSTQTIGASVYSSSVALSSAIKTQAGASLQDENILEALEYVHRMRRRSDVHHSLARTQKRLGTPGFENALCAQIFEPIAPASRGRDAFE